MRANHGIIGWLDSSQSRYNNEIAIISEADNYLQARRAGGPTCVARELAFIGVMHLNAWVEERRINNEKITSVRTHDDFRPDPDGMQQRGTVRPRMP
jgi:rhamnose utilization protein RhaD (predicted bifunctional aldolase and dehydrogenase)